MNKADDITRKIALVDKSWAKDLASDKETIETIATFAHQQRLAGMAHRMKETDPVKMLYEIARIGEIAGNHKHMLFNLEADIPLIEAPDPDGTLFVPSVNETILHLVLDNDLIQTISKRSGDATPLRVTLANTVIKGAREKDPNYILVEKYWSDIIPQTLELYEKALSKIPGTHGIAIENSYETFDEFKRLVRIIKEQKYQYIKICWDPNNLRAKSLQPRNITLPTAAEVAKYGVESADVRGKIHYKGVIDGKMESDITKHEDTITILVPLLRTYDIAYLEQKGANGMADRTERALKNIREMYRG